MLFQFCSHVWIEYNAQQHRSALVGIHAITTKCFVQNAPPASRGIIQPISRFLESRSNIRRMTCFWWQLTHNITIPSFRLSLKESCLMKSFPTRAGCHVATHPKSRSCGSSGICLLIFLLFVLEASQYPSCFCLQEVTLFVRLDGEHRSSGNITSGITLLQVNKIEKLKCQPRICNLGVLPQQTVRNNL